MNTKQRVLALFEEHRGNDISGERIAERLGLSRNAVWKAVRGLRDDGYNISAVTNKGYRLCEDNDIMSAEGIMPFLPTDSPINKITVYDALESTNTTAKEAAIAGAEHGTVIAAIHQTGGKGRFGRQFQSPDGGIYMSVVLRTERLAQETPALITALAAMAVCRAIESVSDKTPRIKWVNDVFLDEKKICGILTEAVTDFESGSIQWMVVGIGVNFDTDENDFPDELRQIVGSVFPNGRGDVTKNQLAAKILNEIFFYCTEDMHGEILAEYKKRLMMLGEKITIIGAKERCNAVAIDIDQTAQLIVRMDNGELRTLSSGEISIRK